MTLTPPDFPHDVAAVREATDRLLVSVSKLDDAAIGEPSLLPGWTRGHVLAHLARNADALGNLLTWARTDVRTPMYASAEARERDIERGADRPLAAQLEDLKESARRFEAAMKALPEARRAFEVEMRNGVVERADRLPLRPSWPSSNCTMSTWASATPSTSCRPRSSTVSWTFCPRSSSPGTRICPRWSCGPTTAAAGAPAVRSPGRTPRPRPWW